MQVITRSRMDNMTEERKERVKRNPQYQIEKNYSNIATVAKVLFELVKKSL